MSDTAAESETARPASVASVHLSATAQLKVPPHSVEAEQSVLGGLMLNNDAWFNVADVLTARDFYRAQHQIIFEAMASLANANEPLDAVTLSEALQSARPARQGRRHRLPRRNRRVDARCEQRDRVRADRSRTLDAAAAHFGAANRIAESAFAPQGRPSSELLDMAESEVFRIHEGRLRDEGPVADRAAARARGGEASSRCSRRAIRSPGSPPASTISTRRPPVCSRPT